MEKHQFLKAKRREKELYILLCLQLPPVAMATDIKKRCLQRIYYEKSWQQSKSLDKEITVLSIHVAAVSCCIEGSTLELLVPNRRKNYKLLERSIGFRKWSKFDQHHTSHKTKSMLTSHVGCMHWLELGHVRCYSNNNNHSSNNSRNNRLLSYF